MNNFEQVSSDDHQMSLTRGWWVCPGGGYALPCDLSSDACDVTLPHPEQNNRQTMPVKNINFPQLPSTAVAGSKNIARDDWANSLIGNTWILYSRVSGRVSRLSFAHRPLHISRSAVVNRCQ